MTRRNSLTRVRRGKSFMYLDSDTRQPVKNPQTLQRISKLRIPPAYTDVQISKDSHSKVQAVAVDSKGRRQSVYHADFTAQQKQQKFEEILKFGKVYDKIMHDVDRLLKTSGFSKDKVIAIIIKIMATCHFRIGSEAHLRDNGSYGLTTLECRHVSVDGDTIKFSFVGKHKVLNTATFRCDSIKKYIISLKKHCKNTDPLFWFANEADSKLLTRLRADDVNDFLKRYGDHVSSKMIRTWQANQLFIKYIAREPLDLKPEKRVLEATKKVAADLHHTVAICKSSYLVPDLVSAYLPPAAKKLPASTK